MEPSPRRNHSKSQPSDDPASSSGVNGDATPYTTAGLIAWSLFAALILANEYRESEGFKYESPGEVKSHIILTLALTTPVFAGFLAHGKVPGVSLFFAFMLLLGATFLVFGLIPDAGTGEVVALCIFVFLLYALAAALMIALGMIICAIVRRF